MQALQLYDAPSLYDSMVPPGPCEAFYTRLADQTGGPILELACGTGRLSIPLALAGFAVTGLDLSPAMLRRATRKAGRAGVAVQFVAGDMRRFDLGRRFPLVVLSCNSLAHLLTPAEVKACLACIRRHLAPDGIFAFDIVNPDLAALAGAVGDNGGASVPPDGTTSVQACGGYDPVRQVRTLSWRVSVPVRGGPIETRPMRLRQFFPQEVPLLLETCGLALTERFGDFDGQPLVRHSLNQVCIARQPEAGTSPFP
jgi:SAM-dependent methyltransferase